MNTRSYIIFVKENKTFKFVTYCGDFVDFIGNFKHKVYFRIQIPDFLFLNKRLKMSWYKKFCEEFYFLNSSGISIVDSIDIFKNNAKCSNDRKLYLFFKSISEKLVKGNSLYNSIKSTNYMLDNMFLSLIKISEETGNLTEILKNLSLYYDEKISINNKLKSSLSYPLLLLSVIVILINLCILYFIPSYVNSFHTQFSNLPSYSITFINICLFIKDNYSLILISAMVFLFVILRSKLFRKNFRRFLLKFSAIRKVYFRDCQLRFIQSLYYMVNSGVDISKSLNLMCEIRDESYSAYSGYIYDQISQGFDFCDALMNTKIFEPEIISIIRIGEKSSNLECCLKNIWTSYSKKYYQNLERYTKLIEPLFIMICGLLVIMFISVFILPLISYDNFNHIWEGF